MATKVLLLVEISFVREAPAATNVDEVSLANCLKDLMLSLSFSPKVILTTAMAGIDLVPARATVSSDIRLSAVRANETECADPWFSRVIDVTSNVLSTHTASEKVSVISPTFMSKSKRCSVGWVVSGVKECTFVLLAALMAETLFSS